MSSDSDVRSEWFPPPGSASPPYAAKHRIADHLRAIIDRRVGADVTEVDPQQLAALEATAADLRAQLEALPDRRRFGSLAKAPLPEGSLVERSPVSGRGNALSL